MRRKTNTEATIFNKYKNPVTKLVDWRRTILRNVHWEDSKAVNVITSGLSTADSVTVFIWDGVDAEGKEYIKPKAFASLPPDMAGRYWTITQGSDRMIKGVVYDDIPPLTIEALVAKYDDCITVKSVDRMDYGIRSMYHWEVSGS